MNEKLFIGDRFTRLARLRSLLAAAHVDTDLRWRESSAVLRAR